MEELTLRDLASGKTYTFFYRMPTVDEWIEYGRQRMKIVEELGEEGFKQMVQGKLDWAEKVVEGVKDDDFGFSSDPQSPRFDGDWKKTLKEKYYYLLVLIADQAFRGAQVASKNS